MEFILSIENTIKTQKKFTTVLDNELLEQLDTAKKYLSNTKSKIVEEALKDYFKKLNIEKTEYTEVVPVTVKRIGYEVK